TPPKAQGPHLRSAFQIRCTNMRPLPTRRVPKSLQGCRVCYRLNGRCSRPVNQQAFSAASGSDDVADCNDEAWWHFGASTSPKPDLMASIWGEASPEYIPDFEGEQLILLWPSILGSRSWGDDSFHPILQNAMPEVSVQRVLSEKETGDLLRRIGVSALDREE
ncbi:hypothetical protein, partial [Halovulum sp. GXIMD14793]